jgi:hypothetical protein
MTQQEQKTVIDGITFQAAPFQAVEGLRLKAHLVRIFGPALGELLGGIGGINPDGKKAASLADINLGSDSFAKGLEKLLGQLDEDSFIALIKRLFANVIASWKEDGKNHTVAFVQDFDTAMQVVFSGRLFSIYPLAAFVLKVNYPDFFGKVVKGIGLRIKPIATFKTDDGTPQNESAASDTSES